MIKQLSSRFYSSILRLPLCLLFIMGCASNTSGQEKLREDFYENFIKETFLGTEATYQNQAYKLPRFSKETPKLGDVLYYLLEDSANVSDMSVCTYHEFSGQEDTLITGMENIFMYDLFDAVARRDSDGTVHPRTGENITLTVRFDKRINKKPVILFIRGINGGANSTYIRVSYLAAEKPEEPVCISMVLVYDHHDVSKDLAEYERIDAELLAALDKGEPLTREQSLLYEGALEFSSAAYYEDYGDGVYKEDRFYDAYRKYIRAYSAAKQDMSMMSKKEMQALSSLCAKLGETCRKTGSIEEAVYFENLGRSLANKRYDSAAILSEIDDICDGRSEVTVGFILKQLFDVRKESVMAMTVLNHDDNGYKPFYTDDKDAIWATDIKSILGDDVTVVFRYSRMSLENGIKDDDSKLCYGNSIIMRICSDGNGGHFASAMIPPFISDSHKLAFSRVNTPEFHVFGLNEGNNIYNLHEGLDSLKIVRKQGYGASSEIVMDLAYKVGFAYEDLQLNRKAILYTDIARDSFNGEYIEEYLCALINEVDPRSMGTLEEYIKQVNKQDPKKETLGKLYEFLLRRKGYLLVEMKLLDEAEDVFNDLLNYPDSRSYAEGELKYIRSLRN